MSLIPKLCIVSYLAGRMTFAQKEVNATFVDLVNEYPDFTPEVRFDGRFWGPVASTIKEAYDYAVEAGLFDEYFSVVEGEPFHLTRELTDSGAYIAKKILDDSSLLSDFHLHQKQIQHLAASVLAFNTLPTKFSVAYALYLDVVKQERKILKRTGPRYRTDPLTYYFDKGITVEPFYRLTDIYNDDWSWFVRAGKPMETEDALIFPFMVKPEKVEKRYSYVALDRLSLDAYHARLGSVLGKPNEEKNFLLTEASNRLDEKLAKRRRSYLDQLISEYESIPSLYVKMLYYNLGELKRNFDSLTTLGYNRLFEILRKVATGSSKYFDREDPKYMVHYLVKLEDNRTSFTTIVPEEMKNEIRDVLFMTRTWHYGMNDQLGHFIQLHPASYLVAKGEENEVRRVGREVNIKSGQSEV